MHREHGDEDLACAEYLEFLLKGQQPDPAPYVERIINREMHCYILTRPFLSFHYLTLIIAQVSTGLILLCWFQEKTDDLLLRTIKP